MLFIPVALSSTRMNWSSLMPWLITPLVSLPCRSLRLWLPCIRKVAEQHDRYQQEKEKKSGGSCGRRFAKYTPAIPRLADRRHPQYTNGVYTGLGRDHVCRL